MKPCSEQLYYTKNLNFIELVFMIIIFMTNFHIKVIRSYRLVEIQVGSRVFFFSGRFSCNIRENIVVLDVAETFFKLTNTFVYTLKLRILYIKIETRLDFKGNLKYKKRVIIYLSRKFHVPFAYVFPRPFQLNNMLPFHRDHKEIVCRLVNSLFFCLRCFFADKTFHMDFFHHLRILDCHRYRRYPHLER